MSAPDEAALRVIVPVLNEARYIEACLAGLLPQAAACGAEVWVMDGGSTDGTQATVARLAAHSSALQLMANPGRTQAAAVNLAARMAPPAIRLLLRADAHALYPPDFIARCTRAMAAHAATSVVVPMRTTGSFGLQSAIAALQASRLGNGGAAHRVAGASGFVDHGHHALFDRRFFLAAGGYDEAFTHNEDAEFDERTRRAGARIYMCREAAITYFPRRTLRGLARQYFRHGEGRMRTLRRHHLWPRLRQLAAPAILVLCACCLALLPVAPRLMLLPAAYAGLCLVWALASAARARRPWLLAMAPAAIVTHLAWGAGFLREAVRPGRARLAAPRGREASVGQS